MTGTAERRVHRMGNRRSKTTGPMLVGPDGRETGHALCWHKRLPAPEEKWTPDVIRALIPEGTVPMEPGLLPGCCV